MIVGGTFAIKNPSFFYSGSIGLVFDVPFQQEPKGSTRSRRGSGVTSKAPSKGKKDEFGGALAWAAKQYIGAGNYWLLNRWGKWEDYTYRDVAADWAMNKAVRLTNKVGQKVIDRATTSPSPYHTGTFAPAAAGVGRSWIALGGLSWMVGGGIILNSFQAVGWNPNQGDQFID